MMPKLDLSNLGNPHEHRGFRKIITIVRLDAAAIWVILELKEEKNKRLSKKFQEKKLKKV